MHEQTVRAHLHRRGIELRGKHALTKAKIESVVQRYEAGESSLELGRAFGVADSTIRNVLKREEHTDAAAEAITPTRGSSGIGISDLVMIFFPRAISSVRRMNTLARSGTSIVGLASGRILIWRPSHPGALASS